jgi:hypothetical protein
MATAVLQYPRVSNSSAKCDPMTRLMCNVLTKSEVV